MRVEQAGEPISYTSLAKILHWTMAVLVIVLATIGWSLDELQGTGLNERLSIHASFGLLFLALLFLRLLWRIGFPAPPLPDDMAKMQQRVASLTHGLLYLLMALVPLTGLMAATAHEQIITLIGGLGLPDFWQVLEDIRFDLLRTIHANAVYALFALILAHIGAALFHQFWLNDKLLARMWFRRKTPSQQLLENEECH